MRFARRKLDKSRNVAAQVEQRVQLDRRFVLAEFGPGKEHQAEIDRGAVERINGVCQFHAERFVGIERARPSDQHLGKIEIDSPVAAVVGIGQRAARDAAAKAGVIEFGLQRAETRFDVAQDSRGA